MILYLSHLFKLISPFYSSFSFPPFLLFFVLQNFFLLLRFLFFFCFLTAVPSNVPKLLSCTPDLEVINRMHWTAFGPLFVYMRVNSSETWLWGATRICRHSLVTHFFFIRLQEEDEVPDDETVNQMIARSEEEFEQFMVSLNQRYYTWRVCFNANIGTTVMRAVPILMVKHTV